MRRRLIATRPPSDGDRFEDLYYEHYLKVRAFVARRVAPHEIDDVVADVFVVAWRRFPEVPGPDHLRIGWLLQTARFSTMNHVRAQHRRHRLRLRLSDATVPAEVDSPEEAVDTRELDSALDRALGALSEMDRLALTLTAWDDLSIDELAGVLECSTGAAKTRLSRARSRLRNQIEEHHDDRR